MVGLSKRILVALSLLALWPQMAAAGGGEFPADGTRGLGRGGTGFTRADDPTVMLRNPALLADLWDDQAMMQSHLLQQDACFNPSGPYGWELVGGQSVVNLGDGITIIQRQAALDANGQRIVDANGIPAEGTVINAVTGEQLQESFEYERFAKVCYEGPNTFLPSVAVSVKLADDLGVGLGFFTPDTQALPQFGNADGTVATANGLRPAETRYFGSNRNLSYFSLMGAVGWRPFPWLRVGAGFQWTLLAFNTTSFSRPDDARDPSTDIRVDVFGRDLFIPAFVGSVHIVPVDWLDFAVGYKWADNIRGKAKLDLTTSPWGLDEPFSFTTNPGTSFAQTTELMRTPSPWTTPNQSGVVDAPPVWSPQLSVGLRISDRLKPRPVDWAATKEAAGRTVEDHMSGERWDLEINGIMYFNTVRDYTDFETETGVVELSDLLADGRRASGFVTIGDCPTGISEDPNQPCPKALRTRREHGGKNQYSLRVGGDYNLFPGLFALRGGVSYETRGVNPDFFDPTNYDMNKLGLHAGFTLRLADKTDLSFAYALFMMEDVNIRMAEPADEVAARRLPAKWRNLPGYGYEFVDDDGDPNTPAVQAGDFDGVARFEVNRGRRANRGPHFLNAGTSFYNLSVLSASITQHF